MDLLGLLRGFASYFRQNNTWVEPTRARGHVTAALYARQKERDRQLVARSNAGDVLGRTNGVDSGPSHPSRSSSRTEDASIMVPGRTKEAPQHDGIMRQDLIVNSAVKGTLVQSEGGFVSADIISTGTSRRAGSVKFTALRMACDNVLLERFAAATMVPAGCLEHRVHGSLLCISPATNIAEFQLQFHDAVCTKIHFPAMQRELYTPRTVCCTMEVLPLRTCLTPPPVVIPAAISGESAARATEQFMLWLELPHQDTSPPTTSLFARVAAAFQSATGVGEITVAHLTNKRGVITSYGASNLMIKVPVRTCAPLFEWYRMSMEYPATTGSIYEAPMGTALHHACAVLRVMDLVQLNLSNLEWASLERTDTPTDKEPCMTATFYVGHADFAEQ